MEQSDRRGAARCMTLGRELEELDANATDDAAETERDGPRPRRRRTGTSTRRWSVGRVAFLAFSAICLYLFAPSIAEVFSAYDRLGNVEPLWLIPATLCAIGSFACVWLVQAIALGTRRLVLGGAHASSPGTRSTRSPPVAARRHRAPGPNMLADAGFDVAHAATALTVQSVLSTAAIVALPVFVLPFVIVGTQVPSGLLRRSGSGSRCSC